MHLVMTILVSVLALPVQSGTHPSDVPDAPWTGATTSYRYDTVINGYDLGVQLLPDERSSDAAGVICDTFSMPTMPAGEHEGIDSPRFISDGAESARAGLAPFQDTFVYRTGYSAGLFAPPVAGRGAGLAENALPAALRGGAADVHVYYRVRNGKNVYVGITNDIARRQAQHGSRFMLEPITTSPVTRGQARAIEEALFRWNPGFQNIRHPISPSHSWYDDAVSWGEAWLRNNGF